MRSCKAECVWMPAEQLTLLPETSDVDQHVRRHPRAREIQQRWTLVALLQKSVMGEVHLHGISGQVCDNRTRV